MAEASGKQVTTRRAARCFDASPEPRQPGVSGASAMAAERRSNGVSMRFPPVALALAGRGPGRLLSLRAHAGPIGRLAGRSDPAPPEPRATGQGPAGGARSGPPAGPGRGGGPAAQAAGRVDDAGGLGLPRRLEHPVGRRLKADCRMVCTARSKIGADAGPNLKERPVRERLHTEAAGMS